MALAWYLLDYARTVLVKALKICVRMICARMFWLKTALVDDRRHVQGDRGLATAAWYREDAGICMILNTWHSEVAVNGNANM